jgi:protein transport protein SEC13
MALPVSFDTQHDDMVHDAQIDYYSRKLATASSDRTVKVWDVDGDSYTLAATLTGHEGPVWQVAWAHPKFGVLLASCSYDGKVLIHREAPAGVWTPIHEQAVHGASVNAVAWAPHEYGLMLGCASADGYISILKHQADDSWASESVPDGSRLGCTSISWAPATQSQLAPMFATGSCDNTVRIWEQGPNGGACLELNKHTDWVRDVAWAPNTATPNSVIASCSEDKSVLIWTQATPGGAWACEELATFEAPVWRVSWSVTGNLLAVSCGDHKVTLWKQTIAGKWENVSQVTDNGVEYKS